MGRCCGPLSTRCSGRNTSVHGHSCSTYDRKEQRMWQGLPQRVLKTLWRTVAGLGGHAKELIKAHLAEARRGMVHGVFSALGALAVSGFMWWLENQ